MPSVRHPKSTADRFDQYIGWYVVLYAQDENPRDILIKYIKSDECRSKPQKTDTRDHTSRIETLCWYANQLDGTEQELNEEQIRKIISEYFPKTWQNDD
jgi:hypothetical protein